MLVDVSPFAVLIVVVVVVVLIKLLHIFDDPQVPNVFYYKHEGNKMQQLIQACTILKQPYQPPELWGKNGHVQTALYGILGHSGLKRTADRRCTFITQDGSTASFDIFEPLNETECCELTLVLCPGLAASSESNCIRTCVHYAQEAGIRCAVLNHIGALDDVEITGNRLFNYGSTEELSGMVDRILDDYSDTRLMFVGFSMGAIITSKFLALDAPNHAHKDRFICFLSVCQGYDANRGRHPMHRWRKLRRVYLLVLTLFMQRLLRINYDKVVVPHVKAGTIDEKKLFRVTSLEHFDEIYSRRIYGFGDVTSFYTWCSSAHVLHLLTIPSVFLNVVDDPIIPRTQWMPVQLLAESKSDMAFVLTKHGGHLGFLEGSSFNPNSVSWIDKLIVQMALRASKLY